MTVKKTVKKKAAKKVPSEIYDTKTILLKLVDAIEKSAVTDSTRSDTLSEVKEQLNK